MVYVSYFMMLVGLAVLAYVLKENYDQKKGTMGIKNDENISQQYAPEINPRMAAVNAANSIELASRMEKISTNSLDPIQLALATAEGGFGRNGHHDIIASAMVAESIGNHIPKAEGDIVLTPEQRQSLARDFANTHLGKIASFTHSISKDGKLIVSADAIGFLSSEYDPILMPGGLVAIVVKNELESELYKALLSESPIFIQNKDSGEVSRIDPDSIKKIVKSGNIDDLIVEADRQKKLSENLKNELSDIRRQFDEKEAESLRLEVQIVALQDALMASQESYKYIVQTHSNLKIFEENGIPEKTPEVLVKIPEVVVKVPEVAEISAVVNEENKRNISNVIYDVIEKIAVDSYINTQEKWPKMGICFIYIEDGTAHIYIDKTVMLNIFNGHGVVDDISWKRTLFYDIVNDEAYFGFTHKIVIKISSGISPSIDTIYPYSLDDARMYIEGIKSLGETEDDRFVTLSNFVSKKGKFKNTSEMFV